MRKYPVMYLHGIYLTGIIASRGVGGFEGSGGPGQEVWETEVPQRGPGAELRRGSGLGRSLQKLMIKQTKNINYNAKF